MSSPLSTALLASAFASSQVYAADIDCSTDLITGTLSGFFTGSLYGSCVFSGSFPYIGFLLSGSNAVAGTQTSASPAAPLPARNLGTMSSSKIVNMGTTAPTFASCAAATYLVNYVPIVTNNWYCARYVGSADTGYMFARWTGSAFSTTTGAPPPNAPTGLSATAASATQINLSWTDASSDETGFKIFKDGTLLNTTAANATSYNATGLTCNTAYTFTVKATNANGDSSAAATTPATTTTSACQVVSAPIFNLNQPAVIYSEEINVTK